MDSKIVPIYPPMEYFKELQEVIQNGLSHAKISRESRAALKAWWNVESTLVQEVHETH